MSSAFILVIKKNLIGRWFKKNTLGHGMKPKGLNKRIRLIISGVMSTASQVETREVHAPRAHNRKDDFLRFLKFQVQLGRFCPVGKQRAQENRALVPHITLNYAFVRGGTDPQRRLSEMMSLYWLKTIKRKKKRRTKLRFFPQLPTPSTQ